ncbi:hypothetical protein [Yoonia vestfoldensis]|uniref:hypothetical protein n=1 Tax=Yoonia vestfoldensis TaxID=245188 RepID=UPI0012FF5F6D|nr:hypothetical protein [Yoonia vestfoldensis]
MSTVDQGPLGGRRAKPQHAKSIGRPDLVYALVATAGLGLCAWLSARGMLAEHPGSDIWQHAAALQALIDNPDAPGNPFIVSEVGSRHFQPLWVAWAGLARVGALDVWQVLALAGYGAMALFGIGVYVFARALHPAPWAPLVLLLCLMLGWVLPIQHTGFHSPFTLYYAAAYPATYMIGCSFLLWALVVRSLVQPVFVVALFVLAAFMFTTHQLGAVIGFIGAGSFALCWPHGRVAARMRVLSALLLAVALSALWPHFNAIAIILRPGNASWEGGPAFYAPIYLIAAFVPSILGLAGMRRPESRALLLMAGVFFCIYLVGLGGFQLAGRFLMPLVLVLHIGLAFYILTDIGADRRRLLLLGLIAAANVTTLGLVAHIIGITAPATKPGAVTFYQAAETLTADIADDQPVAAFLTSAWPVVATGQKVLSVPWPEPLITDLAARQAVTKALFAADLAASERVALARRHDVRSLIAPQKRLSDAQRAVLQAQALATISAGPLIRFDLYDVPLVGVIDPRVMDQ